MKSLSRLADWARHTRRRDRWLTLVGLTACVAIAIVAAAGNSGQIKTTRGALAANAESEPMPADMVFDTTTDVVPSGIAERKDKKAAKKKHDKTRHHKGRKDRSSKARKGKGRRDTTLASSKSGESGLAKQASDDHPVVIGSDVWGRDTTNRFFDQYSVNAATGDAGAAVRATVDWINDHGGIAGRKVTLRQRSFDFYGSPVSTQDDATCSTWATGDVPLVDIEAHASTDILIPCLRKHGIATLVNTVVPPASTDYAASPTTLFAPGSPALDSAMTAYVRGLVDAGFFAGKARVGLLLSTNLPQLGSAAEALKRAIKAAGVTATETAKISLEDPASFFATEASAVLHFRLAKVDHVIALDQDGLTLGQFMRGAEAERYRPVYGVSSTSAPAFLAAGSSSNQLKRAIGVGWSPLLDVRAEDDPGGGATRATCASIFSAAGVSTGGRTPFGQYASYQACDSLLALRAARAVSPATLLQGMNSLSSHWQSGIALGTTLNPSQHHGASAWRLIRYSENCRCFRYDGPVRGM